MRRAIAKQSPVRTICNRRQPTKRLRDGRALPGRRAVPTTERRVLRASLCKPAAALLVAKDNGVLP
jgi:hypothetical protein